MDVTRKKLLNSRVDKTFMKDDILHVIAFKFLYALSAVRKLKFAVKASTFVPKYS